jgi:DNA (cytosine-5)-methyltransferase 1
MTEEAANGANPKGPIAIDLFCGAGGMSLGLQLAGFSVVCAADAWRTAVETYQQNFTHPIICADLADCSGFELKRLARIPRAPVDLVVGGPPCQGFSIQRVGLDNDKRNNLVLEFARLVIQIAPRFFLMENVPGLLGKRGHHILDAFFEVVDSAGYEAEAHIVNAADYGIPQIRRRVIVFGWQRGLGHPVLLPPATHSPQTYKTVWDAIGDLPIAAEPGGQLAVDHLHRSSRLSELNRMRLKHIPPGGGMQDLPVELRVNCHKAGADKIGHRYVYGRLAADRPAGTITAGFDSFTRGRFAHPREDRNITLREGARLQSFPDSFRFLGNREEIAAQIGNAVPPKLAQVLASAVREVIKSNVSLAHRSVSSQSIAASTYPRAQADLFLKEAVK